MLLNEAFENFILANKAEGKSPFTVRFYQYQLNSFKSFLTEQGIKRIRDISVNHLRLLFANLQQGQYRPSSVRSYYATLSVFFNWLIAEKIIKQSPLINIKRPRLLKLNVKAFSAQEIHKILSLVSGDKFKQLRNRAIILLLLDTGIRLNELAKIELKDINFRRQTIKIMGKGAKERIVKMGDITQGAILAYLSARHKNQPYLWSTKGGKPLKREGVQTAVRTICLRANVNGAKPGPHTFRHTAAVNYLKNGGDIFTLQNLLGHSNLEMTKCYLSSLDEEDLIKAHKKFSPVDKLLK